MSTEIAHDLFSPAITSGNVHPKCGRVGFQIAQQRLGFARDLAELKRPGMLGAFAIALASLRLSGFPKPRQLGDTSRFTAHAEDPRST